MTEDLEILCKSAIKNNKFLFDMYEADEDRPSSKMDKEERLFYAISYYGWLVGKHGKNWRDFI